MLDPWLVLLGFGYLWGKAELRVWGVEFRVQFRAWSSGCRLHSSGFSGSLPGVGSNFCFSKILDAILELVPRKNPDL